MLMVHGQSVYRTENPLQAEVSLSDRLAAVDLYEMARRKHRDGAGRRPTPDRRAAWGDGWPPADEHSLEVATFVRARQWIGRWERTKSPLCGLQKLSSVVRDADPRQPYKAGRSVSIPLGVSAASDAIVLLAALYEQDGETLKVEYDKGFWLLSLSLRGPR